MITTSPRSPYLGHAHVGDTYWYLTGIPEWLALRPARFERFVRSGPPGGRHGGTPRCARRTSPSSPSPLKRCDQLLTGFLSRTEMEAIPSAPDRSTWSGQRDQVFVATPDNTGARVSEIVAVRVADLILERAAFLHLRGKDRKRRRCRYWKSTPVRFKEWLMRIGRQPYAPLFPNRTGGSLLRAGVAQRVHTAVGHRAGVLSVAQEAPESGPARSATPAQCISSRPASTSPSSPCGWAMPTRAQQPPTSTSGPISRSSGALDKF